MRIVAPVEGFTGLVVGVPFVGGTASTNDARAIAYFRRQGYTVEMAGPVPAEATPVAVAQPVVPVLPAKPKVEDLRAYAEAKGIDLTGLSRKADLVAAIAAAEGTDTPDPTAGDPTGPGVPTDVVATAGADQVTVTWTAPDGEVTGFEVESIELDPDVTDPDVVIDECTDTTLVVEELVEGVAHQFRVRAVADGTPGDWSEPVTATPGK